MTLSGHESQDITYRYAHMFPSEQTHMADMLNDAFIGEKKEDIEDEQKEDDDE